MSSDYVRVSATCPGEMEMEVSNGGILNERSKICSCAAKIKKVYTAPTLRVLTDVSAKQFLADCTEASLANHKVNR